MLRCYKGFTLIELLVVVLIIGILAAIALPQYMVARDKADFARYQSMAASLRNAYDDYVLIHNKGTKNFEDLSFTLPNNFQDYNSNQYFNCVANEDMWCCIRDYKYGSESNYWSAYISCGKKDNEDSIIYLEKLYNPQGETTRGKYCLAYRDNKRANKFCNTIGSNKQFTETHTPLGTYRAYYKYKINK